MFTVKKFPIWSTEMDDVVGATTGLSKCLLMPELTLRFALGRPQGNKPGKALLFLSPIKGKEQEEAAKNADIVFRPDVVGVEVQGPNRKGGNFKTDRRFSARGYHCARVDYDGDRGPLYSCFRLHER